MKMYSMKNLPLLVLFVTVVLCGSATAARILCVFPVCSKSHMILGHALARVLVEAGHDVTMISPYPLKKPMKNYRDVTLEDNESVLVNNALMTDNRTMWTMSAQSPLEAIVRLHETGLQMTDKVLGDPAIKKLIESDVHFDAVIMEIFVNEAMMTLSHRFNAPLIIFSTVGPNPWTNDLVGNPAAYAHIPNIFTGLSDRMTLFERFLNTYISVFTKLFKYLYYIPKQNELVQKYFPGYPHVRSLMLNTSLILLNSHVSLTHPQPLVPNMIEIGGFHVDKPKPLPADLQKYLDDAKEGVVYFSMGSNLKSKELPVEKRNAFLAAFSKLKLKVLWKWESETMPGQPKNLKLKSWLPQQDVLSHPNVKVFITHGGLLSTIEAIDRGVPLIGIPIFGDQHSNMKRTVTLGYGIMIDYNNLTESSLSWALEEILENPKYSKIMQHRSAVLHDQQINPVQQATWWIDYVIRHKGARHLRSTAADMPLYQYLLLDVIACTVAICSLLVAVSSYLVGKLCLNKKSSSKRSENRNNKIIKND